MMWLHSIPEINLLHTLKETKTNFKPIYTNDPRDQNIQNAFAGFKTKPFGPIKYMEGLCHKSEKPLKFGHVTWWRAFLLH